MPGGSTKKTTTNYYLMVVVVIPHKHQVFKKWILIAVTYIVNKSPRKHQITNRAAEGRFTNPPAEQERRLIIPFDKIILLI